MQECMIEICNNCIKHEVVSCKKAKYIFLRIMLTCVPKGHVKYAINEKSKALYESM